MKDLTINIIVLIIINNKLSLKNNKHKKQELKEYKKIMTSLQDRTFTQGNNLLK